MSVFAGVFRFDGADVSKNVVLSLVRHPSHFSAGAWAWGARSAGLGASRSDASHACGDARGPDQRTVAAGDIRLDNRAALKDVLGLKSATSDQAIVVAAYERWGRACVDHLVGDFAFAIWDEKRRGFFCARDQFGVRPFYYRRTDEVFYFASMMGSLCRTYACPPRLDDHTIATFLAGVSFDHQETFYEGIQRLPAGYCAWIDKDGVKLWAYYELAIGPEPDGNTSDRFKDLFQAAVRARIFDAQGVGALLSGGLDSTSVACVAHALLKADGRSPLITLSAVFDDTPQWSERDYIECALQHAGIGGNFMDVGEVPHFADMNLIFEEQGGLYTAPGLQFMRRVYGAAADLGVKVLLEGHGGDEVVSYGGYRLIELARAGRYSELWKEIDAAGGALGTPTWRVFLRYVTHFGALRSAGAMARRAEAKVRARFDRTRTRQDYPPGALIVSAALDRKTKISARVNEIRKGANAFSSQQSQQLDVLKSGQQALAFETLNAIASARGVELRFPFWDKALVEYTLSCPSREKLGDGWTRLILRKAMVGILPDAICWRRDKLNFTPHIVRGLLTHHRALIDRVLSARGGALEAYVNLDAVNAAYRRLIGEREEASGFDVHSVWRTTQLALYLEARDKTIGEPAGAPVVA